MIFISFLLFELSASFGGCWHQPDPMERMAQGCAVRIHLVLAPDATEDTMPKATTEADDQKLIQGMGCQNGTKKRGVPLGTDGEGSFPSFQFLTADNQGGSQVVWEMGRPTRLAVLGMVQEILD